jgi:hypothetical protein
MEGMPGLYGVRQEEMEHLPMPARSRGNSARSKSTISRHFPALIATAAFLIEETRFGSYGKILS